MGRNSQKNFALAQDKGRNGRKGSDMKRKAFISISILVLAGTFNGAAAAAQGIISKKAVESAGNYCHLKFPAIQKRTLYSSRPVLKDLSEGDIIDFYGPCDYDPLGREEVMRQREEIVRERNKLVDQD
jgi:hypothetical protein